MGVAAVAPTPTYGDAAACADVDPPRYVGSDSLSPRSHPPVGHASGSVVVAEGSPARPGPLSGPPRAHGAATASASGGDAASGGPPLVRSSSSRSVVSGSPTSRSGLLEDGADGSSVVSSQAAAAAAQGSNTRLVGHVHALASQLTDTTSRLRKERTMRKAATTAYKELLASHMAMLGSTVATTSHQLTTALTIGDTEFDVPVDAPTDFGAAAGEEGQPATDSTGDGAAGVGSGVVRTDPPAAPAVGVRATAAVGGAPMLDMEAVAAAARASLVAGVGDTGPATDPALATARVLTQRSTASAVPTQAAAPLDAVGEVDASAAAISTATLAPLAGLVAAMREHAAVAGNQSSVATSGSGGGGRRASVTILGGADGSAGGDTTIAAMDVFGLEACLLQRLIDVSHSAMRIAHRLHHDDGGDGAASSGAGPSTSTAVSRRASASRSSADEGDAGPSSFSALHRPSSGVGAPSAVGFEGGSAMAAEFERALTRFRHLNRSIVLPSAGGASGDAGVVSDEAPSDSAALVSLATRLIHLLSVLTEYSTSDGDGATLDGSVKAPASASAAGAAPDGVRTDAAAVAKRRLHRATARVFRFLHRLLLRFSADLVLALNLSLRTLATSTAAASHVYAHGSGPQGSDAKTVTASSVRTPMDEFAAMRREVTALAQRAQLEWFADQLSQAATAPQWRRGEECTRCSACGTTFGLLTRKHHCRCCGEVVCHACSPHTYKLAPAGLAIPRPGGATGVAGRRDSWVEEGAGSGTSGDRVCVACWPVLALM